VESSKAIEETGARANPAPPGPFKTLVFLPGIVYFQLLESLLAGLAAAGHEVLVAFDHHKGDAPRDEADPAAELRERHPDLEFRKLPARNGPWRILAGAIRRSLDYLRYLEPEVADAGPVREEARARAPGALRVVLFLPPFRWAFGRRALAWVLRRVEAALPLPRQVKALLSEQAPDVVVVSAPVEFGSGQADHLRAAQAARIPSVLVVAAEDEPVSPGTLDAVERAARTEVTAPVEGRFLRPVLWLLTPLLALLLLVLRPRTTARAAVKGLRRLRKRVRTSKRRKIRERTEQAKAREASTLDEARQRKLARAEEKRQAKESAREVKRRTRARPVPQGDAPKGGDQAPADAVEETENARG